jgi:hypothetical protein
VKKPPSTYRLRLISMSGRQTTQFANSAQETICPVTRQPFCTLGATRFCFAMSERST